MTLNARLIRQPAPRYVGLAFVCVALRIVGWVVAAVGLLLVFLSLSKFPMQDLGPLAKGGPIGALYGVAMIVGGLFVVGFGEIYGALRNLARNSFRW
jgi:hypothetical protein